MKNPILVPVPSRKLEIGNIVVDFRRTHRTFHMNKNATDQTDEGLIPTPNLIILSELEGLIHHHLILHNMMSQFNKEERSRPTKIHRMIAQ